MSFKPDWVSPPGDTIRTLLYEKGMSIVKFASDLNLTLHQVQLLLEGSLKIDEVLAGKLSVTLGSTKRFWMKRESQYRSECIRLGKSK